MTAPLLTLTAVLALAAADPGYERTHATSGDAESACLRWPGGTAIVLHLASCLSGQHDCPAEQGAVRAAMQSWNDVLGACASITLVEGAPATSTEVGYDPQATNEDLVALRNASCTPARPTDCWDHGEELLGLTTTTFTRLTGELVDADIEVNGASHHLTTAVGPLCPSGSAGSGCTDTDVQAVVTHELGHLLGLDHTRSVGSLMWPTYLGLTQRTVDPGSADGVCTIYPSGQASLGCGTHGQALTGEGDGGGPGCRCTRGAGGAGGGVGVVLLGAILLGGRAARRSRRREGTR